MMLAYLVHRLIVLADLVHRDDDASLLGEQR